MPQWSIGPRSGDLTHLLNSEIHVDSPDKDFTFVDIDSAIDHLNYRKAAGCDNIKSELSVDDQLICKMP